MFQSLRINQPIYILSKGENPFLEIGSVAEVSRPRVGKWVQNNQYLYQNAPMPMVVDVTAQVNGEKRMLQGLPIDKNLYDGENNSTFVTEDKQLMINEIIAQKQQYDNIISNYEKSKNLSEIYSQMLDDLNPEESKRKATELKLASVEEALEEQRKMNAEILAQLQNMQAKLDEGTSYKTKKL